MAHQGGFSELFGTFVPHIEPDTFPAQGTVAFARLPDWPTPVSPDAEFIKSQKRFSDNRLLCHKRISWVSSRIIKLGTIRGKTIS